jgi:hypothetical protein
VFVEGGGPFKLHNPAFACVNIAKMVKAQSKRGIGTVIDWPKTHLARTHPDFRRDGWGEGGGWYIYEA